MDLTYNDQNPGIQPTPEEIIWANGNDSTMASPMTVLGVMLRIDYQRVPKHDIAPAPKTDQSFCSRELGSDGTPQNLDSVLREGAPKNPG